MSYECNSRVEPDFWFVGPLGGSSFRFFGAKGVAVGLDEGFRLAHVVEDDPGADATKKIINEPLYFIEAVSLPDGRTGPGC